MWGMVEHSKNEQLKESTSVPDGKEMTTSDYYLYLSFASMLLHASVSFLCFFSEAWDCFKIITCFQPPPPFRKGSLRKSFKTIFKDVRTVKVFTWWILLEKRKGFPLVSFCKRDESSIIRRCGDRKNERGFHVPLTYIPFRPLASSQPSFVLFGLVLEQWGAVGKFISNFNVSTRVCWMVITSLAFVSWNNFY